MGKHSKPPMDKCIRVPYPFKYLLMVAIAGISILPSSVTLGAISLSRFVPWRALRGGKGCGYGDGGGCTQYGALAVATYGAKSGLAYISEISGDCWNENPDR